MKLKTIITALLVGAHFVQPATAHADGGTLTQTEANWVRMNGNAICQTFEKYPTVYGVAGIVTYLTTYNGGPHFTLDEAAEITVTSINVYCPQDMPTLKAVTSAPASPESSQQISPGVALR